MGFNRFAHFYALWLSLRFNHHSAVENVEAGQWSPLVIRSVARCTSPEATLEPPTPTASWRTGARTQIIVLIECRKHHAVVEVDTEHAITLPVAVILEWVTSISTVSRHFQAVFVAGFVTDLKSPVLVTDLDQYWSPIWNDQYSAEYQRLSATKSTSTLRR